MLRLQRERRELGSASASWVFSRPASVQTVDRRAAVVACHSTVPAAVEWAGAGGGGW